MNVFFFMCRLPGFLFVAALLPGQTPVSDVESLHILNANWDFKPGWTLQLHSRVRTFENISAFNQFRVGPILQVRLHPRVIGLAGYYWKVQNRRVIREDFDLHRIWTGAQIRAVQKPRWSVDTRTVIERFVSSEFADYYRFRNRVMWNASGNGRKWLPFASAELLRQQEIWYGRYTAGTQYRPGGGVVLAFGYEYRASPLGGGSHIIATLIQFEGIRRMPPTIE